MTQKKIPYLIITYFTFLLLFALSCEDNLNDKLIQKAYVTLQGQDKVAVIDINTGKLLKHVDVDFSNVDDTPHYIVIDNTNNYWYCTLIATGVVLKFNLKTDEFIDSVYVGSMPALMAIDETHQFLYVSRFMPMGGMSTESQEIHQINTQTMDVIGIVNVGADSPHGIALSSDGEILWVASNQASHFFKIETSEFGNAEYLPQHYPMGFEIPEVIEVNDGIYNPLELELNHDDSKLYISCSSVNVNQVRVFDTDTGDSLTTITTGTMPWHMQLTDDGSKLYVANRGDSENSSSVTVVDIATNETLTLQDDSMNMLHGCALSKNNNLLVVTSPGSGSAYIYDTETNSLLHTVNLSDGSEQNPMPTGVAIEK